MSGKGLIRGGGQGVEVVGGVWVSLHSRVATAPQSNTSACLYAIFLSIPH